MRSRFTGLVTYLDRADVDTDAILPKQYLRSISKTGYGEYLFDELRYLDPGDLGRSNAKRRLNKEFILNQPRFSGAQILLCRENFGCGSAREHAVWALHEYGFEALIAPSFGDILANNCLKNNVLPIVLGTPTIDLLFERAVATPGYELTVDLNAQCVETPEGDSLFFSIDPFRKRCLLEDLDEISYMLSHTQEIREFEAQRRLEAPWLFVEYGE